jgi:hypothetical protein
VGRPARCRADRRGARPGAGGSGPPGTRSRIGALAEAIGTDPAGIEPRILGLGGDPAGLAEAGADRSRLEDALDAIEARPELGFTPEPPGRDELRRIIEAAW